MILISHLILIVLELVGFVISIGHRGAGIFAYYTQLSNIVGLLSSAAVVVIGSSKRGSLKDDSYGSVKIIRYLACCMLTMTFLVTLLVLTPATGGDVNRMFFSGSALYHHLLCPVLHVAVFILLEKNHIRKRHVLIPVVLTLVYGLIMIGLNWIGVYDGPYPFFRIRYIGIPATILWIFVLLGAIALISWVMMKLSGKAGNK